MSKTTSIVQVGELGGKWSNEQVISDSRLRLLIWPGYFTTFLFKSYFASVVNFYIFILLHVVLDGGCLVGKLISILVGPELAIILLLLGMLIIFVSNAFFCWLYGSDSSTQDIANLIRNCHVPIIDVDFLMFRNYLLVFFLDRFSPI